MKQSTSTSAIPDPEVTSIRPRKRYGVAFKLRILSESDAAVGPGELAALLRREGLYSSTLADFRQQRTNGKLIDKGKLIAPVSASASSSAARCGVLVRQVAQLERENRRLHRDLSRASLVIDVQKKFPNCLGSAYRT